jgi:hypothetical protein
MQTEGRYCKIGISTNVVVRVAQVQTGCPTRVVAMYATDPKFKLEAYWVEQLAHRFLSGKRAAGEWFECSIEEAIAAVHDAEVFA